MKIRNNGGVLGPKNAGSPSYASGMWSIQELAQNQRDGLWPYASNPNADLNYGQTSLLLHGDGTNGGQNQTFLDSSTNAFTVTRNGNATQGTFSPFSRPDGYWSNYFDGATGGAYLTGGTGTAFQFSGDFTVEAWIYPLSIGANRCIISNQPSSSASGLDFGYSSSGLLYVYSNTFLGTSSGSIPANQWTHACLVRSGTTCTFYINGIASGTFTSSTNFTSNSILIGSNGFDNTARMQGYISNLRVVKGTALYTSNFTVPTTPLTAVSGTSLLACQSNRFKDNSTNAIAFTVSGTPQVQLFSPLSSPTPYVTATNGGSGYFDGSGDYLTVPSNSAWALGTTGTIECWIYPTSYGVNLRIICTSNADGTYIDLYLDSSGHLGVAGGIFITSNSVPLNAWTHIAVVYNSGALSVYFNGVSQSGTGTTTGYNVSNTNTLSIGQFMSGGYNWLGYISNVRIVKGTAVYTGAFTPPTAPFTAITNTQLLLNCQNAAVVDSTGINDFETVGTTQISTTQSKFGGSSMYFDGGSSSYLNLLNNPINSIGDFTVEGWFYSGVATSSFQCLFHFGANSNGNSLGSIAFFNGTASNGGASSVRTLLSTDGSTWAVDATSSTGVTSNNTWYHFAIVRCGGTVTTYINGNAVTSASLTVTTALYAGSLNRIGQMYYSGGSFFYSGYLDDIRITKGVARYLYNFTPPTLSYPNNGYSSYTPPTTDSYFGSTPLLLHGDGSSGTQNNTFLDGSTNAFTITRNGNTTQGTFSPFSRADGYWSNYFDGSSYFSLSRILDSSVDVTIEVWVYQTAPDPSNGSILFAQYVLGGSDRTVFTTTGMQIGSTYISFSIPQNQWTHLAWVRYGNGTNNWTQYVNGKSINQMTYTGTYQNTPTTIGMTPNLSNTGFPGYMSNLRVVKGTAVYTSNFTPSTAPLTAIANTVLLTCQSNRFKDNSTNAYTFTISGSPQVQTFIPFEPTTPYSAVNNGGSAYYDGTGDYLSVADNTALEVGSSNFTAEAWVYLSSSSQTNGSGIFGKSASSSYSPFIIGIYPINNALAMGASLTGASWDMYQYDSVAFPLYTWVHVAMVRSGNTFTLYKNGVSVATGTLAGSLWDNTETLKVGWLNYASTSWPGYITDTRLVIGTAVYTGNFTPPTAPLTAIANTKFLCNCTNGGIIDNAATIDFETVTNAQVLSNQYKFGTGAMYFDASSYLKSPSIPSLNFGTGDFTIEFWMYSNDVSSSTQKAMFQTTNAAGLNATLSYGLYMDQGYTGSGNLTGATRIVLNGTNIGTSVAVLTTATWYHMAVVRLAGTVKIYVNGNSVASGSYSSAISGTYLTVGGGYNTSYLFNGYLDDFRITSGICRYPYNFTIPASAYPNN